MLVRSLGFGVALDCLGAKEVEREVVEDDFSWEVCWEWEEELDMEVEDFGWVFTSEVQAGVAIACFFLSMHCQ